MQRTGIGVALARRENMRWLCIAFAALAGATTMYIYVLVGIAYNENMNILN